ncbi:hypothetical protein GCM10010399_09950 [Dactylosporangium fulvum]|uniref:LLM class flavin-dependent oxidoreductase n=1 Tax=Dactylosporangium fulvum TaxID=53359 RepID=A0ABY5WBV4_9ACTN|nr:LLM class flavin-dependent oxidoreductase [Dactylosporangium fulvum]UWP86820.1 LLM class flavin-dependent oxidoreductase [Dactylosporangium fulvum]
MSLEFLWYIPNQAEPGHRGDDVVSEHNSLQTLTSHAKALEEHGWGGALIGTGWGRPDTFTVATVRKLWTEDNVTYHGAHFGVTNSTVAPRTVVRGDRRHPRLYFGGASDAAERVAATEADVQLFWGEPLDGVHERIERLKRLSEQLGREHPPLEFGLRITTLVRNTTEQA